MKSVFRNTLLFAFFLFFGFKSIAQAAFKQKALHEAQNIINLFREEKFDIIAAKLDSNTKQYLSATVFANDWKGLTAKYGEYVSTRFIYFDTVNIYIVVQAQIQFKYLPYLIGITFNHNYQIASFSFIENGKYYTPPLYADIHKFNEIKFDFGLSDRYMMKAALTLPDAPARHALVIIVGDAGPTDKDDSYDPNKPYNDIAWGLASNGVAVLRYDKRSHANGFALLGDRFSKLAFTCREEYLDDLYEAIRLMKLRDDIDTTRIYILGHGQGGMLAPLIATEKPFIKGIILMAANSKNILDMMEEQFDYLEKMLPEKKHEYDEERMLIANARKKDLKSDVHYGLMPYDVSPSYWLWLRNYDQLKTVKSLDKPVLVLQAGRDFQTAISNYELWQKGLKKNKRSSFKLYPKLNHIMLEGEGESNNMEYYIKGTVPVYVVKDIMDWLREY